VICERFNPNDPRKKSPKLMFLNSYSRCITSQIRDMCYIFLNLIHPIYECVQGRKVPIFRTFKTFRTSIPLYWLVRFGIPIGDYDHLYSSIFIYILGSIIPCKNQPKFRAFEHCHILRLHIVVGHLTRNLRVHG
jgi:hypothetical protein